MPLNIPKSDKQRIVVVGGGFAGLKLVQSLRRGPYQIVLIDQYNFHQFQPLFYQVAMSGLEPSSISFPLRKLFQNEKDVFIRLTKVESVDPAQKKLITDGGTIFYDLLVLAMGADTNFYGNKDIESSALTLKSVPEALYIRNEILSDLERALQYDTDAKRQKYLDIAIVGGGATGVELAGSLAEMKKYIIPKEYENIDSSEVDIYLIQAEDRLLPGMSTKSSRLAYEYLEKLGVHIELNARVENFTGSEVLLADGRRLSAGKMIWAAGVRANSVKGIEPSNIAPSGRMMVDEYNRLIGHDDIFVIGDQCVMQSDENPRGHPQVAQVAIQQGRLLSKNLRRIAQGKSMKPFHYKDKGTLATVGRNKAVADLSRAHFGGIMAWFIWLVVHLFALIGTKNKIFVFFNWIWNYFTYDQSLRLIIRPFHKSK